MCGRYTTFSEDDNFEMGQIIAEVAAKYPDKTIKAGEVFPTNLAPILIQAGEKIVADLLRWGFPGYQGNDVLINARAETAADKKTFKESLFARRCIIPSTGFYEWTGVYKKQKNLFRLPGEKMVYMAGFYNEFEGELRYMILTTQANESIRNIHHRMPVILKNDALQAWIPDTDFALDYLHATMPELIYRQV